MSRSDIDIPEFPPPPGLADRLIPLTVFLGWAGIVALATWFPDARLWGFNHLAFVPPNVEIAFYMAVAVTAVLIVWTPRSVLPNGRMVKLAPGWIGGALLAVLLAILGGLFHTRAPLLGDGFMRASDAASGARVLPSEFLPSLLSHFLASGLPPGWRIGGQNALRVISVTTGALFALGLWWLAPRADSDRTRRIIPWLLTFGAARLFAGYVESYALPLAISALWILSVLAYRRGTVPVLPVVLFSLLAIASHATTVLFIPATGWALWERRRSAGGRLHLPVYAAIIVTAIVLLTLRVHSAQVGAIGLGIRDFLLPLTGTEPHWYGVTAPAHLIDCLNQFILLIPALLAGVALILFPRAGRQSPLRDAASHHGRSDSAFWFLAVVMPILAGLLLDPKLGWARDWDLFAVIFAPAMVGAAIFLARFKPGPGRRALLGVAVLSLGLWLTFSVDANSEIRRFEALLRMDRSRSDYGHEILALYYRDTGRPMAEITQYKEALKVTDNARYHVALGNAFTNLGRPDDAAVWYRSATERDPEFHEAHYGLSVTLNRLGRTEDALSHARKAVILNPHDPEYQYHLGFLLMRKSGFAEALPHLERGASVIPPSARNLNSLGVCYTELGRLDDGRAALERAMIADPKYSPSYLNAARIELTRANVAEVRRLLGEYDASVPVGQRAPLATMIADSLAKLPNHQSP